MTDVTAVDEYGLEAVLSDVTNQTKERISGLDGDIVVLGAGGKMGPTLAMMLKKAAGRKNVYAVSRFSDKAVRDRLEKAGVKTIVADLLNEADYKQLPDVKNVYYLVGMKFGATGKEPLTWAMNTFVPALVARHYKNARIVVFSTGNVYPFVKIRSGGPKEDTPPAPIGEYAQSCLGRERIFQYFSQRYNTVATIVRLNYANEPRYGIIVDITQKILNGEPIDLTTAAVNLIWQRDANDYIAQSITLAKTPPTILNVTGDNIVMVRRLACQIGKELGRKPKFTGNQSPTALLSDAAYCFSEFGPPKTSLTEMLSIIAQWVAAGKGTLAKPTKYDVRSGNF